MIRSENPGRAREIAARLPTDRPLTGVEVGPPGVLVGVRVGVRVGEREIPLVVTYHPAYLLRSPGEKRKAWQDLLFARQVSERIARGERVLP